MLTASACAVSIATAEAQQIPLAPIVVQTPLDGTVVTTTRTPATRRPPAQPSTTERAPIAPADLPAIVTGIAPPTAITSLSGASAIDKNQLDQQFQADRIGDVLKTIPGVAVQETARDTAQAVNIRGLQDFGRVNVMIDGMRQNFQRSGHSANGAFYIEPEMVKRVDVTRGPAATVYGSGAIGGVVNFDIIDADDILKKGETWAARYRIRWSTNGSGPFGSATGAVRIGNFDVVTQLSGRDTGDYRSGNGTRIVDSGEETISGLARMRWRPADGHQISGTYIDYDSDFVDRPTATSATRYGSVLRNRQANIGYTFSRPDTPLLDQALKIYRNETDLDQTTMTGTNTGRKRGFNIITDGFDISNTSRFGWGPTKLALTYGVDGFTDQVTVFDNNVSNFSGSANTFTPNGERSVKGGFLQAHFNFFRFVDLITAARFDSYSIEGGTVSLDDQRLSPKVTLGVTPLKGITVFTTYAEGFRAPAVTETLVTGTHAAFVPFRFLPNPALRPEVAHNIEAGVNLRFDGIITTKDAFRAKVVVFKNSIEDYIDGQGIDGPGSFCFSTGFPCLASSTFQYVNFANVTIKGVEAEMAYDARLWFMQLSASRIRGTDDDTGSPLLSIPADRVTLTLGTRLMQERLLLGVRTSLVDAQNRVPLGATPSQAYTLVDLFAQYAWSDSVVLNLNIDNVFDEQYIEYRNQSASPGLNARIGATMRFGGP